MRYQLWDRGSGNQLGEFPTESDALDTVQIITEDDPGGLETLVLLRQDTYGHLSELASGTRLGYLLGQYRKVRAISA